MSEQRSDRMFESALPGSLRRQQGGSDGCPTPDVLAAYWDRSLTREEAVQFEAHAAACTRCQASLAALARTPDASTERPLGPAPADLGWLFDWRWIAPVATVAVVMLAVWVIEPASPARQEVPTFEEAELAPRETPARELNESADRQARRDDLSTAPLPAEERFAEAPAEAPSAQTAENRSRVQRRENALTETDTVQVDEVESLAQRSAAATAAAPDRLEDLAEMERPEPAPERRIAAEALASRGAAVADPFSLVDADATVMIATPIASVVWRVLRPGSIERSSDGGSTWISQLSDQDVELTAGSAPTASVCWVVGRGGVVFRTTDGQTWERLATPAVVDLIEIEASDASTATVTATDGTRYGTSDAGETWRTR